MRNPGCHHSESPRRPVATGVIGRGHCLAYAKLSSDKVTSEDYLNRLLENKKVFFLDERGLEFTSVELSKKVSEWSLNSEDINDKLSSLAAEKILDNIDDIYEDKANFIEQDHSLATYASKIQKSEGQINWKDDAKIIIGLSLIHI